MKSKLERKGYSVRIIPFHKWVFANKLRARFSKVVDTKRKDRNKPYVPRRNSLAAIIKPPIAFIDNLLFYLTNRPDEKNCQIYIYDRFICATQVKFKALNYRVGWFKPLWWNILPDIAFIFDINERESIKRQKKRKDTYTYTASQLKTERILYKNFANSHNFPIISPARKEDTINMIMKELNQRFEI